MKRLKRYGFYALLIPVLLLAAFLLTPYFLSPVYHFSQPQPFAGQRYYNPYQQMDSSWITCNFHAHSHSWGGLTDGKNSNIDTIFDVYQQMGYSHIGISNYQRITPIEKEDIASIPAYEHGFNIKKRHHLCLGADRVSWLDFFFFQTLCHKQFVLDKLRPTTDFLTVNHPKFAGGFEESDFTYLSNYDAIEVLNHYRTSIPHWDSALSSGYYAVLLANDDMHKLDKMDETGVNFTVVNTNSLSRYDIIQRLKAGRHYGVKAHLKPNENYQIKAERIKQLIHPHAFEIKGDSLSVTLDAPVSVIRFIGQGGKVKDSATTTEFAQYIFRQTDTYIRIEIEDMDSNLYLFNPVVRTDSSFVTNPSRTDVNWNQTNGKRIVLSLIVLLSVFGLYRRKRKIYNDKFRLFFQNPYQLKLTILLLLSVIIKIIIATNIELTNDEVYYRLYALYPDWSHFDHPPVVGWLIQLTTLNLLCDSELFIRLGAIILGTLIMILAFKTGQKIHSDQAGFIAAFLFCISPYVFLASGTFILPDTALMFFWMLALWKAVSIFDGEITNKKANQLLLLGVFIGLAVLSKYTALFLWLGIGLYILFYKRSWLRKWQLYVSVLITICCMFPIIYWNMNNDFISFAFHGDRVSLFTDIRLDYFFQELLGGFLYNSPFLFVLIYVVLFRFCFGKEKNTYNPLFYCIGLPMILLFLFFAFFRNLLPHWSAPGYTSLIFPVAIYITEKLKNGKKGLWIQVKVWAGILILLVILFLLHLHYAVLPLKKYDVSDISIELSTWKKTGKAFALLSQKAEKEGKMPPNAPVIASNWFPAANLDMYVAKPTHRKVLAIGDIKKIHKYAWINSSRGGFSVGMDAWYITDDYDFDDPAAVSSYFETISSPDTLLIMRNNEILKQVYVYQLQNMKKIPKSYIKTTVKSNASSCRDDRKNKLFKNK
ncbi:MAG: glycosyltransferase family 39 protein [Bacteroidales bacterium]|nr:glycosyltransferase family 39 protein [Bacteroidales bacterium]